MRVKGGIVTKRKHSKILEQAKGYRLSRSKNVRKAMEAVMHAGQYSYIHRRKKAGQYRKLWITRIGVALDAAGVSYSKFIAGLKVAKVEINRKMLAELAVNQPEVFNEILTLANVK